MNKFTKLSKLSKIGKFALSVVLSVAIMFGAVGCVNQPADPSPSSSASANPSGNPDTTTSPNPSTNPSAGKMPPLSQMGKTKYRLDKFDDTESYIWMSIQLGALYYFKNQGIVLDGTKNDFTTIGTANVLNNVFSYSYTFNDGDKYYVGTLEVDYPSISSDLKKIDSTQIPEYLANLLEFKTTSNKGVVMSKDFYDNHFGSETLRNMINEKINSYYEKTGMATYSLYNTAVKLENNKLFVKVYDLTTLNEVALVPLEGSYKFEDNILVSIENMSLDFSELQFDTLELDGLTIKESVTPSIEK